MKSLVVYSSKSGNTKKLAEAVYAFLDGEKELAAVSDAPNPSGYSFVAVGFWLENGQPDPEGQKFLASLGEGQEVYLFATHEAAAGSAHAQSAIKAAKEMAAKARVTATFSCPDQVAEQDLKNVVRMLQENNLP